MQVRGGLRRNENYEYGVVFTGTMRWRSTAILNANSFSDVPALGGALIVTRIPCVWQAEWSRPGQWPDRVSKQRDRGRRGMEETRVLNPTEEEPGEREKSRQAVWTNAWPVVR